MGFDPFLAIVLLLLVAVAMALPPHDGDPA